MTISALHIVGQLGFGGITTWLKALVQQAPRKELSVDICCNFRTTEGEFASQFRSIGCEVYHIPLSFNLPAYGKKLRRILKLGKYDIIHDHRGILSGASLRAAYIEKVPVRIMYHHTPDDELLRNPVRDIYAAILRKWAFKYATHIWGCSRSVMAGRYGENWEQADPRFSTLYGTVHFQKPSKGARNKIRNEIGLGGEAKIVGFIGRVNQQKNVIVGIKACIEVLHQCPEAIILWIGEGPFLEEVIKIAQESGFLTRILFHNFRKDITDILQAIDVLFLPSNFEGFPLLVLEALQAGVPLVGSNTPGILEALPPAMHDRCASAVDIDGHVKNILRILTTPTLREIPTDFLKEFTKEAFYKRILTRYKNCLLN
jgi:glycosyltransferase EpsF